ncbi:hypothetical protein P3X46_029048 [Hevea brasiliensis]|uniref:Protein PIN-LIKES 3-like n=1 Tax=Hevea brasiliensis TaxID=3981 RepID=A0ABQ9KSW8_HEVBR|nr:protein PIN-LIKES 3 [Hevea brasiliensis]KAJ9146824.1 hypothetical protein P3X46_029048 [Hevea brasiliensis]
MRLLDLFVIASMPVLKVLLLTGLGSFLALDHVNILGEDTRKQINQVVFYVFNPALVGSNLANTITIESMELLWFMPFNILVTFIIGSALGWILIKITGPPKPLKGLILGCCAAGNMGNLPLIIIPAICKEKGSPFGPPDVCYTNGIAYASLSMAIGAVYLWSYVYNIIRICSSEMNKEVANVDMKANGGTPKFIQENNYNSKELTYGLLLPDNIESQTNAKTFSCTRMVWDKIKKCIRMISEKLNLKSLLAPSTTGAVVGFVIGLVPQIRKLLIGAGAPLRAVEDSAFLLGDAAIPIVTLIVGGNLLSGLKGSGIRFTLIVGILAVRYIFLPLLGIITVKSAVRFGLVHSDPLYQFILLLQFAVPPAMNIGTMTQLFGTGQSECSVIMLWAYALASVSLTLWSTIFLWMVS